MLSPSEIAALGEYRMMTPEELEAAPVWQEMPPTIVKRMVSPFDLLCYKQVLKQEAKKEEEYKEGCRVLFLPELVILPQSAVKFIKARQDWVAIDTAKDIIALRNAVLAAVANPDIGLYTPFQLLRSTKDVVDLRQRKGKTVHAFHDCCAQTFYAHQDAGHGWPIETHYQEEVKRLLMNPEHDCSQWAMSTPNLVSGGRGGGRLGGSKRGVRRRWPIRRS